MSGMLLWQVIVLRLTFWNENKNLVCRDTPSLAGQLYMRGLTQFFPTTYFDVMQYCAHLLVVAVTHSETMVYEGTATPQRARKWGSCSILICQVGPVKFALSISSIGHTDHPSFLFSRIH